MDKHLVTAIRVQLLEEQRASVKKKALHASGGNLFRAEWWDGYSSAMIEVLLIVNENNDRLFCMNKVRDMTADLVGNKLSPSRNGGKRCAYDFALALLTVI